MRLGLYNAFSTRNKKLAGRDFQIDCQRSGLALILQEKSANTAYHVLIADHLGRAHPIYTTGRDLAEYTNNLDGLPLRNDLNYIETGAGLGELIPHLARLGAMPVAIDPLNYEAAYSLLETGKKYPIQEITLARINTLQERIKTICDPNRVRLYNMTLGEATKKYPELSMSADCLIDLHGPGTYSDTEKATEHPIVMNGEANIQLYREALLAPNGKVYAYTRTQ